MNITQENLATNLASTEPEAPVLDLHLTLMRYSDLDEVLALEDQIYPRPWTKRLFESELVMRSSRSYYVARLVRPVSAAPEGTLIGYGGLIMAGDEAHVSNIGVDPRWQRQGVASRILLQLTADSLARKAVRMTLEVRASNEPAKRLYMQFGYMPVGMRKNYYYPEREDAIIMTAHEINTQEYLTRLQALASKVRGKTTVANDPRH